MQGHAGGGKHGKAAVVQLLQLHLIQSLRRLGSDLQWVPAEVTRALEFVLDRGTQNLNGGNGKDDLRKMNKVWLRGIDAAPASGQQGCHSIQP